MLDVTSSPCLCLSAGIKVEPVCEETKAKYDIWKPFIFRGKVWDERKKIQGFFIACLTFAFCADERRKARRKQRKPLLWAWALPICPTCQASEEGSTEHLLTDRGHFQRHSQPREGGQRCITPLWLRGSEEEKETRFAQNLFFYAACVQISSCFKKEKYISIELRRKRVCCDYAFWFFICQFLCWCFLYSDVQYVYLCTEAADRDVNKLYICKFELSELVGKYFAIEPINNST